MDKVQQQRQSRHALSLSAYDGEGFAGKTLRERGGTEYRYTPSGVTISRAGASVEAPIAWLFGSGRFARTPLLQVGSQWVEHRVSWYAEPARLSLTPGHSLQPAADLDTALGIPQSAANAARCFNCHRTGDQPGVHCANCHGSGVGHPRAKSIRRDPSVAACAVCHRSPAREYASPEPEVDDPMSVRFAPVGFLVSRCYRASAGRFTCVTCHNPHADAQPSAAYDPVCQGCHGPPRKTCPRSADCASCHMPKSTPAPYLTFTDHRIR